MKQLGSLMFWGVALLMAGCTPTPRSSPTQLLFLGKPPLKLKAGQLQVERSYTSPKHMPYVEHRMVVTPEQLVSQWLHDHFELEPHESNIAVVTIEEASIREVSVGRAFLLYSEDLDQYCCTMRLRFDMQGPGGQSMGQFRVSAQGCRKISPHLPMSARQKEWQYLMESTLNGLHAEVHSSIKNFMSAYIMP